MWGKLSFWGVLLVALVGPLTHANTLIAYQNKTQRAVGQIEFRWFGFSVYDAALYSPTGRYDAKAPYVLELTYHRALGGESVATTTLSEMERLGFNNPTKAAQWQTLLTTWFSGITQGTKLAAMHNANGYTTFIRNGTQVLGTIADAEFTRYFFGIWLDENSRAPKLRNQLIGMN
jgi:Chalcone isomerase-like